MSRIYYRGSNPPHYKVGVSDVAKIYHGTELIFPSGFQLSAATGTFSLFGQAMNFNRLGHMDADVGTFTLSGQSVLFKRSIPLSTGSFALTGQDADFSRSRRLAADVGTFTLNGQDIQLISDRDPLVANPGVYFYTGYDAEWITSAFFAADVGTFTLAGQDAGFLRNPFFDVGAGSFVLSGQDAGLLRGANLPAAYGSYVLTGQAINLSRSLRLTAAAGSFALAGQNATLTYTIPGPTSFTFVASANSQLSTITVPATAQAGDIAILIDGITNTKAPTDVVPSGWTGIGSLYYNNTKTGSGIRVSRKILTSGDVGATITGMNETTEAKVMLVFRPNAAITTVTLGTINNEATGSNPTSQTVSASGQPTPLLVIGAAHSTGGSAAFSTASPAFDATVVTGGSALLRAGYKIYNSSPADHSIDMNDLGDDNTLVSFYLRVS